MRGRTNRLITFILLAAVFVMQLSECAFAVEIPVDECAIDAEIVEEIVEELPVEIETEPETVIPSEPDVVNGENIESEASNTITSNVGKSNNQSSSEVLIESDKEIVEELVTEIVSDNEINEEDDTDIAELTTNEAGIGDFPESYKVALTNIWKSHPTWKYERVDVNLDWDTVVTNEMEGERSLIEKSADGDYVGKQKSGNWHYATKAGVSHYLDPRNYLDDKHLFAYQELDYNSKICNEATVRTMVTKRSDSFMRGSLPDDGSKTYSNTIYNLGKNNKTNPMYLVARIFQEQGYTGTALTNGSKTYEGKTVYNYFNIKGAYESEASYAYHANWFDSYTALDKGIQYIYNGYIKGGQNTLYMQKWDVTNAPYYTHQYMQNIRAPYFESEKLYNIYKDISAMDNDYVFKIPVYKNMPDAPDTKKDDKDKTSDKEIPLTEIRGLKFAESEKGVTLRSGSTIRLNLSTVPGNLTPEPIIKWAVSNNDIATVDCDGNITAKAPGETFVTATSEANTAIFASCKIVVEGVHIRYRKLDGEILLDRSDAAVGAFLKEYPFSEEEVFPASKIEVLSNQRISGFYTAQNRAGVRVTEDTEITGDMDIYPFLIDIDKGFEVRPVGDLYYTGLAIMPEIEVYNKDILLKKGKDYTVKFANNKIANTDVYGKQLSSSVLKPTIIIKGKGNYTGTETLNFNIRQADLATADIDDITLVYKKNKTPKYGKPVVYLGKTKLKFNKDYTVSYPVSQGNLSRNSDNYGAYIAAGVYPVVIKGMGSVAGERVIYEYITKKIPLSKFKITKGKLPYGKEISANDIVTGKYIQVYYNNTLLKGYLEGSMVEQFTEWDYKVELPKNMDIPGNKSIKIIGNRRNGYYGTKKITLAMQGGSKIYLSRSENLPGTITISDPDVSDMKYTYVKGGVKPAVKVCLADGKELVEGRDITITYKNYNKTNAMSAKVPTIIVKGKGFYAGAVSVPYTIVNKDIVSLNAVANAPEFTGKAGASLAKISVFDENGQLLKAGSDYSKALVYKDVATGRIISKSDILPAGTKISVSINGTGCYSGVTSAEYEIRPMSVSKAKVYIKDQTFTGKAISISQNDITIFGVNGTKLGNDDYEILDYSYSNNINKGKASVYIMGKGNYSGIKKVSFKITVLPIVWYYNK